MSGKLKSFESFLINRQQGVVLKGQCLKWVPALAVAPQGSILGQIPFFMYISDLPFESSVKLFADVNLLFSIVHDPSESTNLLNDDLERILIGLLNGKCFLTLT